MKKRTGVVHRIATCMDCDKIYTWYKTAHANGRRHAEKTGHTVNVEVGTSIIYNPK